MNSTGGGFIDVDKYQQQLAAEGNVVERIATFYERPLPVLHQTQNETRMACEFKCGKDAPTGDRVLAVSALGVGHRSRSRHGDQGCHQDSHGSRRTAINVGYSRGLWVSVSYDFIVATPGGRSRGWLPGFNTGDGLQESRVGPGRQSQRSNEMKTMSVRTKYGVTNTTTNATPCVSWASRANAFPIEFTTRANATVCQDCPVLVPVINNDAVMIIRNVSDAATPMRDHVTTKPVAGLLPTAVTSVEASYGFSAITIPDTRTGRNHPTLRHRIPNGNQPQFVPVRDGLLSQRKGRMQ